MIPRYSRPQMVDIWEPETRFRIWFDLWFWIRGDDRGDIMHTGRAIEQLLWPAFRSDRLADPLLHAHVRGYCAHWNLNLLGWRDADAEAFRQALAAAREAGDPGLLALHVVRDVYFKCWQSDYRGASQAAEEDPEVLLAELKQHIETHILPEMTAVDADTGFRFEELSHIPGFSVEEDSEVVQLTKSLTGANTTSKVAFGTEAGLFQSMADIPTVVCGPGSIEQAHKPNEFIEREQIAQCEVFLRKLFDRCAS